VDRKCAISVGKKEMSRKEEWMSVLNRRRERSGQEIRDIGVPIPIEKEEEKWTLCGQEMEKWTVCGHEMEKWTVLWTGNGEVDCL
jgi:hypothetical protein